ncbi:hypothetical protein CHS0354_005180 [Potamilus streckersoni]|uniref:TGF-beta family profile domain-containing protein n=1 Tax=Potamilus streckersoni TaxID=2493646 RepID=A0AAE0W4N5_9BIVA|nr:hypothetical protein CHS0354_005180 [Potamilus streckersoni]
MYANTHTMRFLHSLAFMVYFYNLPCFQSTLIETGHGVEQTIANNRMPEKTKTEMQKKILDQHQIHKPTKINVMESSAAQYMLELYNMIVSAGKNERPLQEPNENHLRLKSHFPDIHEIHAADLIMSFVNDAYRKDFHRQDRDHVVYFDISGVPPGHIFDKAELKLYKWKTASRGKSEYLIEIFRLRRDNDTKDKILEPKTNLTVSEDYEGWLSIQITHVANYWNRNRQKNFGLYVQVTDVETDQEIYLNKSGIRGYEGPKDKQPFMIGFVNKQDRANVQHTEGRAERSTNNQPVNEDCKRHPLYINYTALGWKYIISPEGYDAYYCAGDCVYSPAANVTHHAVVQGLLNLRAPDKIPKPCCSPSKLSKSQVLYSTDNQNVILKHYRDMVVEACDCF